MGFLAEAVCARYERVLTMAKWESNTWMRERARVSKWSERKAAVMRFKNERVMSRSDVLCYVTIQFFWTHPKSLNTSIFCVIMGEPLQNPVNDAPANAARTDTMFFDLDDAMMEPANSSFVNEAANMIPSPPVNEPAQTDTMLIDFDDATMEPANNSFVNGAADMIPSPPVNKPARTDTMFFDFDDAMVEPASSFVNDAETANMIPSPPANELARTDTKLDFDNATSSSSKLLTQQETIFFDAADSFDRNIATLPVATMTQFFDASTRLKASRFDPAIPSQKLAPHSEDKVEGRSRISWLGTSYPEMHIENPWAEGKSIAGMDKEIEGDSDMLGSNEISVMKKRISNSPFRFDCNERSQSGEGKHSFADVVEVGFQGHSTFQN